MIRSILNDKCILSSLENLRKKLIFVFRGCRLMRTRLSPESRSLPLSVLLINRMSGAAECVPVKEGWFWEVIINPRPTLIKKI